MRHNSTINPLISKKFCSGFGQFHTNEPDKSKPDKKLKPYNTITFDEIRAMVDKPQAVSKTRAQWSIFSTLPSRNFSTQEKEGEY